MAGVQPHVNAPTSPPVELQPGWYWYQWPPQERVIWERVKRESGDSMFVKREYVAVDDEWGMAVVFFRAPFAWRMRGTPTRAPKGEATTWDDVLPKQVKPRGYTEHYKENASKAWNAAVDAAAEPLDKLGNAANFLLWGGVAVLLVNVWRSTSPR